VRDLFISEHRYITNLLRQHAGIRLEAGVSVIEEYYAPPRTVSKVLFNNDYCLQFASNEYLKTASTKAYCAGILPNTLGVDAFVLVDQRTSLPLMTELLGGEAFSLKHFNAHVATIETRLAQLSTPLKLKQTCYCRVFVIDNDICFLAFLRDSSPVVRGEREILCANAESMIACSSDTGGMVYVDGWIRTCATDSDRKLEAIAVDW
jgi:hypothetical protein